jgi:hypothetical protein
MPPVLLLLLMLCSALVTGADQDEDADDADAEKVGEDGSRAAAMEAAISVSNSLPW